MFDKELIKSILMFPAIFLGIWLVKKIINHFGPMIKMMGFRIWK